ncbi:MAG: DNA-directed RNA polymerase subunit omega [Flavobacterium sp.]
MEYKEEEEDIFSESGSESGSDNENEIEDDDDDVDVDDEDDVDADLSDAEDAPEPQPRFMEFSEDEEEEQDDDDEDELNENYLQKLDNDVKQNIISDFHPELNTHSMEEVEASCTIIRDDKGVIIDPLHRTLPFVTRYEKARAIGERAKQINSGAKPFIEIDQSMIDGYLIALKEFEAKKIPFIIRRPLPNGNSEYWRLSDLEIIA